MDVSVIVPLYNKARYVSRALSSISAQAFGDFEVIVVDDGSTDDGLHIAQAHPDKRVRVISQTNAGPGAARNRGLAEAEGKYVAFLDADDAWCPSFLSTCLAHFSAAPPEVATVTTGYFEMPSGASMEPMWRSRKLSSGIAAVQPETPPNLVISFLAYLTPCTTVARTEIVRRYGGFYDRHRCCYGEDAYLWLKLLLNEQFLIDLEPRVEIYRDASSLSGNLSGARPIEPFLLDSSGIERSCPPQLRLLLQQVLAIRAFKTACVLGYWGDWRGAAKLRRGYSGTPGKPLPYQLASMVCATPIGALLGTAWRTVQALRPASTARSLTSYGKRNHAS